MGAVLGLTLGIGLLLVYLSFVAPLARRPVRPRSRLEMLLARSKVPLVVAVGGDQHDG